jgi:hypothetical protein
LTFDRPLDEGEPKGLDSAVYQRIKELKWSKKHYPLGSYQHKNIDAVLEAYRTGKLKVEPGLTTDWLDGKRVEPLDLTDNGALKALLEKYSGRIPLYTEIVCESSVEF